MDILPNTLKQSGINTQELALSEKSIRTAVRQEFLIVSSTEKNRDGKSHHFSSVLFYRQREDSNIDTITKVYQSTYQISEKAENLGIKGCLQTL